MNKEKIINLRREIHKNPELAFNEFHTAKLIENFLLSLGLTPKCNIAKTGITADICGKNSGKTLLLRADMDALPLTEQTGLSYSSVNKGVMHACGHDVHITTLLACAELLCNEKSSFNGQVRLVFQPAEEGAGGAKPMIDCGILDNPKVDAAFAFHISNEVKTGCIMVKEGSFMASPDHFFITIHGVGGHGARPELCKNPVDIGSELVCKLKQIKCEERFVISIGAFLCGTNENIIADEATLKGTARTLDPKTRKYIYNEIMNTIKEVEKKYGVSIELDYHFLYPPLINDKEITNKFIKTAKRVLSEDCVKIQEHPDMIGEDFAYFAQEVPSCMAKLGGAKKPLHSADFTVDEEAIFVGANLLAEFAKDFLA